jgi:mono-ADP-ribosyltransferase sirtuin 6
MALAKLYKENILKFVVTLNTDGLHIKSGIPREKVAELHGNKFVEICEKCGYRYEREEETQNESDTESERVCEQPNCDGRLLAHSFDSKATQASLEEAKNQLQEADLCLCLGVAHLTSALIQLLLSTKKRGTKLVLVTVYRTELERHVDLRIHALCDDVMFLLMKALNFDIPSYITNTSDNETIEICFDDYTFQGALKNRYQSRPPPLFPHTHTHSLLSYESL